MVYRWMERNLWLAVVITAVSLAVLVGKVVWAQYTTKRESVVIDFENGLLIGSSSRITGAAGTGNASLNVPVNTVGLGGEVSGFAEEVIFCGQLPNATTGYLGPGLLGLNGTPTDYIMGGTACDALDSGTEATADAPLSTLGIKLVGMRCKQSVASGAAETTVYTARSAAANVVTTDGGGTTISCAINGASATECVAAVGSTTDIAASATTAVQVVASANLSAQDGWCKWLVAFP